MQKLNRPQRKKKRRDESNKWKSSSTRKCVEERIRKNGTTTNCLLTGQGEKNKFDGREKKL